MKHLGRTEPFRDAGGKVLAGSIAEVSYRRLGGLEQWVMIRGESAANPPLVLLHGGPGFPESYFHRHFNAPLEKHFTVVYWDQRGSGKSFDRRIPRSSMTAAQFVTDLDELVDAARERTGQEKVVLFGHSWGSVLGVLYAARFPEKVSVYVGGAQIGDWPAAEAASYAFALAEARRLENRKALEELQRIGPPPYGAQAVWTERLWVNRFEGHLNAKTLWDLGRMLTAGPEFSLADLPNLMRGFRFSLDAMWAEVSAINLLERVPQLAMPVLFFLGRQDHWVPPHTSVAYFEALRAPSKRLVWFEQSGHELFADEPEKFNAAMIEVAGLARR